MNGDNLETKICTKCNKEFPATTEFFHKKIKGKYGLSAICKNCTMEYHKKYYIENKERIIESNKELATENKEKRNELNRKWYHNNLENAHKYSTIKYHKYKELIKLKRKTYIKSYEGKTKAKIYKQKRRSLKKNLLSTLTIEQWEQIKKDFNYKCAYCGSDSLLEQDHFIALSKGGEYSHNNIIPVCKSCNCSKNNKDFFEWYPKQNFYSRKLEQKILSCLGYTKDKKQQLKIAI